MHLFTRFQTHLSINKKNMRIPNIGIAILISIVCKYLCHRIADAKIPAPLTSNPRRRRIMISLFSVSVAPILQKFLAFPVSISILRKFVAFAAAAHKEQRNYIEASFRIVSLLFNFFLFLVNFLHHLIKI